MDLTYSDEQRMLRDSFAAFLTKSYTSRNRENALTSTSGHDGEIWTQFAKLGWLALPLPEAYGGSGCGPIETALLMESFGRALVMEPWLPAIVLGAGAIMRFGSDQQKSGLLPELAAGTTYPALAHIELQAGYDLAQVRASAVPDMGGYRLSGRKTHVLGAAGAGYFLVTARTSGEAGSQNGIGLFIVPAGSDGLVLRPYRLADGTSAAHLDLDGVLVGSEKVLSESLDFNDFEALFDAAIAAMAADSTGAMDALLGATVEYLKQRAQFGSPLSKFQALRHRVAEMKIMCEEARAAALLASMSLDRSRAFRIRCVSGAKTKIGRVSRKLAQEAMQLHGAMGVSEETPVGHLFKRLFVFENTFGSTAYHLERYRTAVIQHGAARGGLLHSATL